MLNLHIGRSWSGTEIEDACPCPKAPCGLAIVAQADPKCSEHPPTRLKSIRQAHSEESCPATRSES